MNVKRYFAPTAREALRALKEELGADAIVLSNRAVDGGVEILALPADAVGALQSSRPAPAAVRAPRVAVPAMQPDTATTAIDDRDFHVSLSALAAGAVPRNAAGTAPRRGQEPELIRAFNPPRVDAGDYLARSGVYSGPAQAARPVPAS